MKNLLTTALAALLCSCGGANYTITGRYELPPGDSVYLLASDNTVLAAGETIALSSLTGPGRWVLLDFWATWCTPCMNEVPHLKKAYETFHAKGFEIYGVSLDTDLTRWENIIGEQGMNWINVAQKKGGGFDPTALYAVSSIPANFLISPKGKIVAKNLRGEHLEEKLAEVLK